MSVEGVLWYFIYAAVAIEAMPIAQSYAGKQPEETLTESLKVDIVPVIKVEKPTFKQPKNGE